MEKKKLAQIFFFRLQQIKFPVTVSATWAQRCVLKHQWVVSLTASMTTARDYVSFVECFHFSSLLSCRCLDRFLSLLWSKLTIFLHFSYFHFISFQRSNQASTCEIFLACIHWIDGVPHGLLASFLLQCRSKLLPLEFYSFYYAGESLLI